MKGSASILDGVPDWRDQLLDWKERFDGEASQIITGIDRWSQRLCGVTRRCMVSSACAVAQLAVGLQAAVEILGVQWCACLSRPPQGGPQQEKCNAWAKRKVPSLNAMDAHVHLLHTHCRTACCNPRSAPGCHHY